MSKIQWKGGTLLAPVPVVIVSCGSSQPNLITIAWTGIINSDPPKTYISVRPERHSHHILKESGEFVINLVTKNMTFAADYCGLKTGRTVDKFKAVGFTKEPAKIVGCPMIKESPLSIECKITDIISLGSHDMMLADIVAVNIEEKLLDSSNRLNMDKAELICYNHGEYFELGKKIAKFGYSCKKITKKQSSLSTTTKNRSPLQTGGNIKNKGNSKYRKK